MREITRRKMIRTRLREHLVAKRMSRGVRCGQQWVWGCPNRARVTDQHENLDRQRKDNKKTEMKTDGQSPRDWGSALPFLQGL